MKRIILTIITILLFIGVVFCFTAVSVKAGTHDKKNTVRVYDSIKVAQGDTLQNIADEYNTSGCISDSEYISEIKRINSIYTDTIHAGCYLTVICYQ